MRGLGIPLRNTVQGREISTTEAKRTTLSPGLLEARRTNGKETNQGHVDMGVWEWAEPIFTCPATSQRLRETVLPSTVITLTQQLPNKDDRGVRRQRGIIARQSILGRLAFTNNQETGSRSVRNRSKYTRPTNVRIDTRRPRYNERGASARCVIGECRTVWVEPWVWFSINKFESLFVEFVAEFVEIS